MNTLRRALCMAVGATVAAPSGAATPAALRFGMVRGRLADPVLAAWRSFAGRMAGALARSTAFEVLDDGRQLAAAFLAGQLDMAWAPNLPALEVVESGAGHVVAQLVGLDGRVGYRSVLVTHREHSIQTLDDVLRSSAQPPWVFGDGEPTSVSGHLVPLYYAFVKRGVNAPATLFRAVRHATHRENLQRAARREVDFATANDVELDLFRRDNAAAAELLRVFWQSPEIPQSPLVCSARLSQVQRQRLLQAALAFGRDEASRGLLRTMNNLRGFRASRSSQLVPIADLEMFSQWQQVYNDATLDAAEKARRIGAISERAARIELRLKRDPDLR